MEVMELRPGLWRWTAPHQDWRPGKGGPGGWERMVACHYYEPPAAEDELTVLIDPLVPPAGTPEEARFWAALDKDVEGRGHPVMILLGNHYHERSAQAVHDRYVQRFGGSIQAREETRCRVTCGLTDTFAGPARLRGGIEAFPVEGLNGTETAFFLTHHGALAVADALIGTGSGQVRLAPPSWTDETPEGMARYQERFRSSLAGLMALPIEMLLVSHGPPVLENGRAALAAALEAPAWGE